MLDAPPASTNFNFLTAHSEHLVTLAGQAERYLADDPNTCLIKLRQFAELLAQRTAANSGLYLSGDDSFMDTINRLRDRGVTGTDVSRLFHSVRRAGNSAAHHFHGTFEDALISIWWPLSSWNWQ